MASSEGGLLSHVWKFIGAVSCVAWVDCNPFLPICAAMNKYMVLWLGIKLYCENIRGIRTKDLSLFLVQWSFKSSGKYRGLIGKIRSLFFFLF